MNQEKNMNQEKGVTTIEFIIAVGAVSLLIGEVGYLLFSIITGYKQRYLSLENVDNSRVIATQFVNEIRSAVYGVDGSAPIIKANSFEIVFHSPDRKDPSLINRIRYFVSNNNLYKSIIPPSSNPLRYDSNKEKIFLVQKDLVIGNTPVFLFYNGQYNGEGSSLLIPPNVINDIRFVRINLTVLKQTRKGSQNTFTISSGATIRSLKDNLGN